MIEGQRFSRRKSQASGSCPTLPRSFQLSPGPFQIESRRLRGPVPLSFETFYRANLRFVPGERLRSSDVSRYYGAWAAAAGAPSLTYREIKRAMSNIGHPPLNSNGVQYRDVALAADWEALPDNFPAVPLPTEAAAVAIADRLDAMISELSSIRAGVIDAARSH